MAIVNVNSRRNNILPYLLDCNASCCYIFATWSRSSRYNRILKFKLSKMSNDALNSNQQVKCASESTRGTCAFTEWMHGGEQTRRLHCAKSRGEMGGKEGVEATFSCSTKCVSRDRAQGELSTQFPTKGGKQESSAGERVRLLLCALVLCVAAGCRA